MSFLISACHGRRSVWSLELQNIWCDWLSAVNAALTEGEMNEVERWNGDDTSWLECTINNVVLLSYVISWGHLLPVLSLWFIEQNVTLIEQEKTCTFWIMVHLQNTSLFQWFAARKQLKDIHFCLTFWFVGVQLYDNEQISMQR